MQIYLKKPILSFFQIIAVYINLFSNSAPFLLPLSPANAQSQTSPSRNAYTPEYSDPPTPAGLPEFVIGFPESQYNGKK